MVDNSDNDSRIINCINIIITHPGNAEQGVHGEGERVRDESQGGHEEEQSGRGRQQGSRGRQFTSC